MSKTRTEYEYSEKNLYIGLKVKAYRNITTGLISIKGRDADGNDRVLAHVENITLKDCTFPVAQSTRKTIVDTFKNTGKRDRKVHAFVVGYIVEWNSTKKTLESSFTYNPFVNETFIDRKNGAELKQASLAQVDCRSNHQFNY